MVVVLTQHTNHFELEMVLLELYQSGCVFHLFVEAPERVHENGAAKVKFVLLFSTVWKHFVEVFIIYYFILEIFVRQLDYGLLRATNFGKELEFCHLKHFKYYQGFNVRKFLSKIANERGLTHEVACLLKVKVLESTQSSKYEVLYLLDIIGYLIKLPLYLLTIFFRSLFLIFIRQEILIFSLY